MTERITTPSRIILLTVDHNHVRDAKYRETHLLANLGWVDLDLGYSTILPSCSASSANFPSAQAEPGRGWNGQNQSQPNPGSPGDGSPCRERMRGTEATFDWRSRLSNEVLVKGIAGMECQPRYHTRPAGPNVGHACLPAWTPPLRQQMLCLKG